MAHPDPLSSSDRPAIHMIEGESELITAMTAALEKRNPVVAALLYSELDRAELRRPEDMPADTVTMNCKVDFIDERSGLRRTIELVYPGNADIGKDRISILTPMGAGLIGMTAGESIAWPDRSGAKRLLTIVSITPPPTSDGNDEDGAERGRLGHMAESVVRSL
ncbi:MAG: nucleoside diphosphate kinase regulator [Sphingomonas sp.]